MFMQYMEIQMLIKFLLLIPTTFISDYLSTEAHQSRSTARKLYCIVMAIVTLGIFTHQY